MGVHAASYETHISDFLISAKDVQVFFILSLRSQKGIKCDKLG